MKDRPKKVRRRFSLEFKQQALGDVHGGMSLAEAGRKQRSGSNSNQSVAQEIC